MATEERSRSLALVLWLIASILLTGGNLRPAGSQENGAKGLFRDPSSGALVQPSTGSEKRSNQSKPTREPLAAGPERAQKGSNTGLRYKIEVVGENGEISWVTSKRTFFSGERVRFHFETNVNGYLLIIHKDPSGKSAILFPDPRINNGDNYVEKGTDYIIPPRGNWFRFDQNPGKEELTVFLSQSRMEEIDKFKEKQELEAEQARSLYDKAEQVQGDKGLYLEVAETEANQPTYVANASHDPKALLSTTIILNHR